MRLFKSLKANAATSSELSTQKPFPQETPGTAIGAIDLIAVLGFSCYIFWELLGVFDSLPFISPLFSFEESLVLKLGAFSVMTAGFFVLALKGAALVCSHAHPLVIVSVVLVGGTLSLSFLAIAAQTSSLALGMMTWCLYSLSLMFLMATWAAYFATNYTSETPKIIATGYALGFFLFLLCSLSTPASSVVFLFIGFVAAGATVTLLAFLIRSCTDRRLPITERDSKPDMMHIAGSLARLSPIGVLQTASFGMCYGFAITLLQFSGQHLMPFGVLGGFAGSIILLVALQSRGLTIAPNICRITFIPVALAMLFLPIGGDLSQVVCGMIVVAASIITAISSWMHSAQDAATHGKNPVEQFASIKAPGWGGFLVGILAAALIVVIDDQLTTIVVAVLVALICVSFALSVLRTPDAPKRMPTNASENGTDAPTAPFSTQEFHDRLGSIATLYGLSARELDVLLLLAKGRNAEFIADKLSIARPTAKTHIQHIYQKTAVNSQQELISLIDRELEKERP